MALFHFTVDQVKRSEGQSAIAFPTDLELYRIMTTKLTEVQEAKEA